MTEGTELLHMQGTSKGLWDKRHGEALKSDLYVKAVSTSLDVQHWENPSVFLGDASIHLLRPWSWLNDLRYTKRLTHSKFSWVIVIDLPHLQWYHHTHFMISFIHQIIRFLSFSLTISYTRKMSLTHNTKLSTITETTEFLHRPSFLTLELVVTDYMYLG